MFEDRASQIAALMLRYLCKRNFFPLPLPLYVIPQCERDADVWNEFIRDLETPFCVCTHPHNCFPFTYCTPMHTCGMLARPPGY